MLAGVQPGEQSWGSKEPHQGSEGFGDNTHKPRGTEQACVPRPSPSSSLSHGGSPVFPLTHVRWQSVTCDLLRPDATLNQVLAPGCPHSLHIHLPLLQATAPVHALSAAHLHATPPS